MKRGCIARGGHPPPALATADLKELEIRKERHTCSWHFRTFLFTCFLQSGKYAPGRLLVWQWHPSLGSEPASGLVPSGFPQWYARLTWDTSSPTPSCPSLQPGDTPLCFRALNVVALTCGMWQDQDLPREIVVHTCILSIYWVFLVGLLYHQ